MINEQVKILIVIPAIKYRNQLHVNINNFKMVELEWKYPLPCLILGIRKINTVKLLNI